MPHGRINTLVLAVTQAEPVAASTVVLDVTSVHAAHANFVWRTLQRLGVCDQDLQDAHQEVFLVVHRRLRTFDGSCDIRTWLFAICIRVVAAYRRSAYVRRVSPVDHVPEDGSNSEGRSPEDLVQAVQARRTFDAILDQMDLHKRAIFVMFEIEGMSCVEIAASVGIPLGTVYSRLGGAREEFDKAVKRLRTRALRGGET